MIHQNMDIKLKFKMYATRDSNKRIIEFMTKEDILKKLQEIQANNIGIIDCHIETRKDMKCTQIVFSACNYEFDSKGEIDKKNKSKLYVHRFKWTDPNYTEELKAITEEIKYLDKRYN